MDTPNFRYSRPFRQKQIPSSKGILLIAAFGVSNLAGQTLESYRDQNNDAYVEWTAQEGYNYTLQTSADLQFWTNDSTWLGVGQTVSILVHEGPNGGGGGGGGVGPALPQYTFAVTVYPNGDNLISWKGDLGSYQLYTTDTYFSQGDDPLFQTDVTDPNGDYTLFLYQIGAPLPPNAANLTLAALPQAEQDRVGFLTAARQQIVNELAANGGANGQNGVVGASVGDAGYFRLIIRREDSDGDGLYNNLETSFGLNPYDPDTDNDGVTDPWDHANIGHVIISEFMASNSATVRDGFGEYSDYIELFNPTSSSVNIGGYWLTCDPNDLFEWQIPVGTIIDPGQSLLIFASNNDTIDPLGYFHTSFRLSASGEDVILSAPNGALVDNHPSYGRQRTNASAGWGLDQGTGLVSKLRFFLDPTPGSLNSSVSCGGFSATPIINLNGGIFSSGVQTVTISPQFAGVPGEEIHFTLDGSNPTGDSPIYSGPITVDATTIVRAVAVVPGCIPSPIITRTYVYKTDIIGTGGQGQAALDAQTRPNGYPELAYNGNSVQGPLDYEMDPDVLPDHYDTISGDLDEIPSFFITVPKEFMFGAVDGFYAQSSNTYVDTQDPLGLEWQRLASFEYYDPNNALAYSVENGEVTISGGSSRSYSVTKKHNLRIRMRSRNSLEGSPQFKFETAPFAGTPLRDFVQLQLRNPTHDSWAVTWGGDRGAKSVAIREAWARKIHDRMNPLVLNPGGDPTGNMVANRRWVHLFLNGLYWGVYDFTERIDQDMGRAYGDENADYDVMSQSGVVDGDQTEYDALVAAAVSAGADSSNAAKWQDVTNKIDLDSYIDYMIVNTFMANIELPGNNWRAMRRKAAGAKWKFLVWDAEFSFDSNSLQSDLLGRSSGAARVHGALLGHPDYQQAFKDRVAIHFNTPNGCFSVNAGVHEASEIFQEEMDDFEEILYSESARWGDSARPSKAYTFLDPTSFPGQTDRGDWDRTSRYHRDVFIQQRRAIYLGHLQSRNFAN